MKQAGEAKIKVEGLPTKMAGYIEPRMIRCGKPNCKCAKGELHGPYYVQRWRSSGHKASKYIKKQDVLTAKLAVETYRRQQKQARRELQEALRTLRGFRVGLLDLFSQGR